MHSSRQENLKKCLIRKMTIIKNGLSALVKAFGDIVDKCLDRLQKSKRLEKEDRFDK